MGRMLGWAGLALALALGAAVRWTPPVQVEDLRPRPDALEYEEAARALAEGAGYCLILDGGCYPPRYPPGFSLLLVPAMWLADARHGSGIWVVLASALAGIAAVWTIGLVTGGPASAAAAALLLALAPLHVRWSRAVMSDVPTATVTTLLALGGILCGRRTTPPRAWLALGIGVGLSALLRSTCLLLAPLLAIATLVRRGEDRAAARRLVAFGAGIAAGLVPTALYGLLRFGSPLASGYDYWVAADFFGWTNVTGRPAGGGTEGNLGFYARQLVGLGSLYGWPVALLATAGLFIGARQPGPGRLLAWITAGTTLALLAVYLPFFWQWDRFLLPVLPLILALAALAVGATAPYALRLAGAALVALTLALAWLTPRAFAPPDAPLGEVAALRAIAGRVERNAVLIARSNVVLVSRLFHDATDRLWVPVGRCEHRRLVRDLKRKPVAPADAPQNWVWDVIDTPFDSADVEGAIGLLLASGRPVYFAPILSHQSPLGPQLTALLGSRFRLEPIDTSTPTGLMRVRARS
jgi:4-amino-4-deoxy-L-arabinose transferase-like glycosyltransferase